MDDATRLCLDADLLMALLPLAGQRDTVVTRQEAITRAMVVVDKYLDAAMTSEDATYVEHVGDSRIEITVAVDPLLLNALCRALERTWHSVLTGDD